MTVHTATHVRWPGGASLAEGVPEGWHMRGEAAQLIGRSKDTLKRWHKEGVYAPSGYQVRGELTIWLYSDEDIVELIKIAQVMKTGRPPHKEEDNERGNRTDHG
jgi:hypothetical protein